QGRSGAVENAAESVIVGCANRIELVVVAAGAGDGEAKKSLSENIDFGIAHLAAHFFQIGSAIALFSETEETAGQWTLVIFAVRGKAIRRQDISRDVLADE